MSCWKNTPSKVLNVCLLVAGDAGIVFADSLLNSVAALLEQVFMAALDVGQIYLAEKYLSEMKQMAGTSTSEPMKKLVLFDGLMHESRGEFDEALKLYGKLLHLQINAADPAAQEARAHLKADGVVLLTHKRYIAVLASKGMVSAAVESLNKYLNLAPMDGEAWCELAMYHLDQCHWRYAIHALQNALLCQPHDPYIYVRLGEVYFTMGGMHHLLLARKNFAHGLKLYPDLLRGQLALLLTTKALDKFDALSVEDRKLNIGISRWVQNALKRSYSQPTTSAAMQSAHRALVSYTSLRHANNAEIDSSTIANSIAEGASM